MFNIRHKLALWAVLVCLGFTVLLGGSARTAFGVVLLGFAFSWAFGSNHRLVHWLFVVAGVILFLPALGDAILWPRTKSELIKLQNSLIDSDRMLVDADLNRTTVHLEDGTTPHPPKTLPPDFFDRKADQTNPQELIKDEEVLRSDEQELRGLQAEGIFRHVLKDDWITMTMGMLLLIAGLALLVGGKPVRRESVSA